MMTAGQTTNKQWNTFPTQGNPRSCRDAQTTAAPNYRCTMCYVSMSYLMCCLRRSLLMRTVEGSRHFAHEAVHLLLHLRVRLEADVEIEDHLGEARRLDL